MKLLSLQRLPLTIVICFNLFTFIVFLIAPIHWATENLLIITFLVLISQLAIATGFELGCRKSKNVVPRTQVLHRISDEGHSLVFLLCSMTFPLKYAYLLRFNPSDIAGMFNFLMAGVQNPQLGYALAVDPTKSTTVNWYIYFIISIINQLFFIIGFLGWKKYSIWKKAVFLLFLAVEIFYWMGIGTNFGVIILITTFLFTQLNHVKVGNFSFTQTLKYSVILLVLLIGAISVFSYNLNARVGLADSSLDQFDIGDAKVDRNNGVFSILPSSLHNAYMYLVIYLSQGYYHACLAFDLNFKWTCLVGNNPALTSLAGLAGLNVWEDTYVYRLWSMGVHPLVNWHTAYIWFASDVSLFGVPVMLFVFGYIFGYSWALGVNNDDFLSKIIFVIFGNILLLLFANNTYLSSVFYSGMFIFPIWCITRLMRVSRRNC